MDSFTAISIAFFAKEQEAQLPVNEEGGSGGLCVVAAKDVDVQLPINEQGGSGGLCVIA